MSQLPRPQKAPAPTFCRIEIDGQQFATIDDYENVKCWLQRWVDRVQWTAATQFRVIQFVRGDI